MGKENKGRPSGVNKSDEGTGVPTGDQFIENPKRDQHLTDEYTNEDREVSDNVQQNNPNRNTDKGDATNAGGYKE